jgi:hypothetical protein
VILGGLEKYTANSRDLRHESSQCANTREDA